VDVASSGVLRSLATSATSDDVGYAADSGVSRGTGMSRGHLLNGRFRFSERRVEINLRGVCQDVHTLSPSLASLDASFVIADVELPGTESQPTVVQRSLVPECCSP